MGLTKGNYELQRIGFDFKTRRIVIEVDEKIFDDDDGLVDHVNTIMIRIRSDEFQTKLADILPATIIANRSPRKVVNDAITSIVQDYIAKMKAAQLVSSSQSSAQQSSSSRSSSQSSSSEKSSSSSV